MYNKSWFPQIGIYKVASTHKGIKSWCIFFVVLLDGSALLGMLHCKKLQLLSIHCDTIQAHHNREVSNKKEKFQVKK